LLLAKKSPPPTNRKKKQLMQLAEIPPPPLHRPTGSEEKSPKNLRGSHFNHLLFDTGIISYFGTHFQSKKFELWEKE
jgi:hypothetical protein